MICFNYFLQDKNKQNMWKKWKKWKINKPFKKMNRKRLVQSFISLKLGKTFVNEKSDEVNVPRMHK